MCYKIAGYVVQTFSLLNKVTINYIKNTLLKVFLIFKLSMVRQVFYGILLLVFVLKLNDRKGWKVYLSLS